MNDHEDKQTMDFTNQNQIFNPKDYENNKVIIIGAGSTGSFIALTLAKMGIQQITVIDNDEIEEHNIPHQFYTLPSIGKKKVEALQELIQLMTGITITTYQEQVKRNYPWLERGLQLKTILIICTDNVESRKDIFESMKYYPNHVIDTRMGGEEYTIHLYHYGQQPQGIQQYEKLLQEPTAETPCGEKSIIYTILSIASTTSMLVKMLLTGQQTPLMIRKAILQGRELRT